MKRYAVKVGPFYMSRYPTVRGCADPFDANTWPSEATAREAAREIAELLVSAGAEQAGDTRVVQLTLVEQDIDRNGGIVK